MAVGADEAPTRIDRRKARTRAALIAAAQRLLAEGRTAVAIQEITDTADVGFGSFYNHFTSKDELFEAAVMSTIADYDALMEDAVSGIEDPAEVFATNFRITGRLQRIAPELVRVILNSGASVLTRAEGLRPRARRDLQIAMDAGRLEQQDLDVAFMIAGGSLLGLLQLLDSDPDADADALSDAMTVRVLRALGVTRATAEKLVAKPLPEIPPIT